MAPNDFHRVSLLPYHYPEVKKQDHQKWHTDHDDDDDGGEP